MPSVKRENSRLSNASNSDETEGLIRRTNLQGRAQPSDETGDAAPAAAEPSIEEVKNRMGAALHRIKNRVEELQAPVIDETSVSCLSNEPESVPESSGQDLVPDGINTHSTIRAISTDELAKRKAQIVAAARAAEAKAREAEGKFREFESRLEKEIELRQLAEARMAELEKLEQDHQLALESEEKKARQISDVIKDLEARIKSEVEHRDEAEKAFLEAQVSASSLKQTLNEYDLKRKNAEEQAQKAETYAKELESRAQTAEAAVAEAHARLKSVEQEMREIEALVYQSDTNTTEMEEKFQAMEIRLRQETELRLFAESQLKSLADEIFSELGEKLPENFQSLASPSEDRSDITEKLSQNLLQEIENERKARRDAENEREAALQSVQELESALRVAEQKLTQTENQYESLLRAQPVKAPDFWTTNSPMKPANALPSTAKAPTAERKSDYISLSIIQSAQPDEKFRQIKRYKFVILLLMLLVVFLCIAAYQQL
jgi:myosin heavy subunit